MLRQPSTLVLAVVVFALAAAAGLVYSSGVLGGDNGASNSPATAVSGEQRVLLQDLGMT
jgi:hypothetical protein